MKEIFIVFEKSDDFNISIRMICKKCLCKANNFKVYILNLNKLNQYSILKTKLLKYINCYNNIRTERCNC